MSVSAQQRLTQALMQRNTAIDKADVAAAFESVEVKQRANKWVEEYISPDCLLTLEERSLSVASALE